MRKIILAGEFYNEVIILNSLQTHLKKLTNKLRKVFTGFSPVLKVWLYVVKFLSSNSSIRRLAVWVE